MKVKKSSSKKLSETDSLIVDRVEVEWTILSNDFYKTQMQKFNSESCRLILNDTAKAIEYARKGLEKMEPEKLTDENIEIYADGMQTLAKIILDKRMKKKAQ